MEVRLRLYVQVNITCSTTFLNVIKLRYKYDANLSISIREGVKKKKVSEIPVHFEILLIIYDTCYLSINANININIHTVTTLINNSSTTLNFIKHIDRHRSF